MTSPSIEIVVIGDEILNGTVVDSNSAWLGARAEQLGAPVRWRQVVPDVIEEIVSALELARSRADVVITSGGLGPTVDDRTAEAVARFLGVELKYHADALAQISARRARSGRMLGEIDKKQAFLPATAQVLENIVGTAPAFAFESQDTWFVSLPGVPREWKALCDRYVLPELSARAGTAPVSRTWKFYGYTESVLATRISELDVDGVELHYRPHFPEIHLTAVTIEEARMDAFDSVLTAAVGHRCFGGADATFAGAVVAGLARRGWTVATAESCTGGLIAQMITSVSGSSDVFGWGFVSYANEAKTGMLGVDPGLLAEHGAVSRAVVEAMAMGVREHGHADIGVAVSGIAGPGGGSADKPVGTIHFAVASPHGVEHKQLQLPFDRERNRVVTAYSALALTTKHVMRPEGA